MNRLFQVIYDMITSGEKRYKEYDLGIDKNRYRDHVREQRRIEIELRRRLAVDRAVVRHEKWPIAMDRE